MIYTSDFSKLRNSIQLLNSLNDATLLQDQDANQSISYIRYLIANLEPSYLGSSLDTFMLNGFQDFCTKYLLQFDANLQTNSQELSWDNFENLQFTLYSLLTYSKGFLQTFSSNGGLNAFLTLLSNPHFNYDENKSASILFLKNIYFLSKDFSEKTKATWVSHNAADRLLQISETFNCILLSFIFTNIVQDEILDTQNVESIIKPIKENLERFSNELSQGNFAKKLDYFYKDDDIENQEHEVHFLKIDEYESEVTTTEILLSLYQLSLNEKIASELINLHNIHVYFVAFLTNGTEIEKKYCLQLLLQLCFNKEINSVLSSQSDLVSLIESLAEDSSVQIEVIHLLSSQILRQLKSCNNSTQVLLKGKSGINALRGNFSKQKQIMISYNYASRDLCLQVKEYMENLGFFVWIDVCNMHGSTTDAMATAVESSDVFFMCVTEKYRQSWYCRSEAEYAYTLRKPIIPLIMEDGLQKVKGWLGFIIGDKIYIDFSQLDFHDCLKKLEFEVSKKFNVVQEVQAETDKVTTVTTANTKPSPIDDKPQEWTSNEVLDWMRNTDINGTIINLLEGFDGDRLFYLMQMKKEAPQFFYEQISNHGTISLFDITHFVSCLSKLFK